MFLKINGFEHKTEKLHGSNLLCLMAISVSVSLACSGKITVELAFLLNWSQNTAPQIFSCWLLKHRLQKRHLSSILLLYFLIKRKASRTLKSIFLADHTAIYLWKWNQRERGHGWQPLTKRLFLAKSSVKQGYELGALIRWFPHPVSFEDEHQYLCTVICGAMKREKAIRVEIYCEYFSQYLIFSPFCFKINFLKE